MSRIGAAGSQPCSLCRCRSRKKCLDFSGEVHAATSYQPRVLVGQQRRFSPGSDDVRNLLPSGCSAAGNNHDVDDEQPALKPLLSRSNLAVLAVRLQSWELLCIYLVIRFCHGFEISDSC